MFRFLTYKKRAVGQYSVLLRRKSVDFEVFDYVFKEKYHRAHKPLLHLEPIILDLGTNIGLTIVDFKMEYPGSVVYGFEMDKDNFNLALKNTKKIKNVHLLNKAVWFEDTQFTYSKNGNFDAYKLSAQKNGGEDVVSVSTISIDQIIKDHKLSRIDYVKMDIEGAEKEIFQSNLDWLRITNQIKIEIHYGEEIFNFIRAKLETHGFTTVKDTHHWSTIIGYRE